MSETNSENYIYDFHTNHGLIQPKETYNRHGLCGLVNLGNKCFLNSILQCLSNTLKLTDYFLSKKHLEDDPQGTNKRKNEYYLVISYVNLMVNMWETNQLIKPKSFVENISVFVKKYFSLQQQDSHECLVYILDILHRGLSYEIEVDIQGEVKNSTDALMKRSLESWRSFYEREYSFIVETFGGMFYNQVKCNNINCTVVSDVFEPYNCLSINIPQETTDLDTCLNSYFNTEQLDSWCCDKCGANGCTRNNHVWTFPNYLVIHLKRFTNDGKKNISHVNFPTDNLNITRFVSPDKRDPNNYIYSLYAVNYHSGDLNSGHYWSCCKNTDDNWYLFNDGNVSKLNTVGKTSNLLTKDAYILFYYRKFIKTPIQI